MSPADFDVAVVGSGFAGSLAAILARRLGRSVVLLERAAHPRFAIGESSSPLANLLLESLCDRYDLPRIRPLAAWGTWQRERPEIACGLKRGFTFYGHDTGRFFAANPDRSDQLLVAASPCDEVADTHWYRPEFDHFLAREAEREGAVYLDRTAIDGLTFQGEDTVLETARLGSRKTFRAHILVDASGPRGFLHRALGLGEETFAGLPATSGLYTHFTDVRRLDDMNIFSSPEAPPYPVDAAAVHHVFEGGWIWVLRFNNGITSAGVAAAPRLAGELAFPEGAPAWDRLLARLPTVREQFSQARAALPFVHRACLPFRTRKAAGPNWVLLPSAAAFVDPILSTGFPLTLLGLERLAGALERSWGTPAVAAELEAIGEKTLFEADTAAALVAALYASFDDFPLFAELSKLYFAAASYAEAARRLSRPGLAGSFLAGDHPGFGPASGACCRVAAAGVSRPDRQPLLERIRAAVEPLDVIGLSEASRRNWYPVLAHDLRAARGKLGATAAEIEDLIRRVMPSQQKSPQALPGAPGAGLAPSRASRSPA